MFKSNRYLIIASTIGIVSIACLMILFRQIFLSSLIDQETRSNVVLTEVLSKAIWPEYRGLVDIDTRENRDFDSEHPEIQRLDAEVKQLMLGSKLLKVKIYNLEGLTIYSTDLSQINQDKSGSSGFLSARDGTIESEIIFRNQFYSLEGIRSDLNAVSSYIPVNNPISGELEAVFEVYSDVNEFVAQKERLQWEILFGVLASVSVLFTLLIMNSRRLDNIRAARIEDASINREQIHYHTSHDTLTGLINRQEFERRTERLIASIPKYKGRHALCFMDLDQFKVVNDTCGHVAGDEMLRQISDILRDVVKDSDTIARLGGDEFAILMENCTQTEALSATNDFQHAIQDLQFIWEGKSFRVGVSIGLVAIDVSASDFTELMKQADAACYMAKEAGRHRIQVYNSEDTGLVLRQGEMKWVARIHEALEEDRFCLYAQPILPLDNSCGYHYELLIRMIGKDGRIIPPGTFLPAAERYNLVEILDAWVIKNVFKLLVENPGFVEQIHYVAINLSGPSLTNRGFLEFIVEQLNSSEIDPSKICFEITETLAISNFRTATHFISNLRELGCRFALDDFGSGLSSFGYLKNLKVDCLKIDGMFVKNIVEDPIDRAMVKSINDIGHVMGMKTIAEFVENDEIRQKLVEMGIDYGQGYGLGKPQPLSELLNQPIRACQ